MRFTLRALLLCILFFTLTGVCGAMQITDNGQAVATIVIPQHASETERFAAAELQKYLQEISGGELPIQPEQGDQQGPQILIGHTSEGARPQHEMEGLDPEAFIVRLVDDDLLLVGASDRATLYAVYDFLEQDLGCRWLGPGPTWEEIPERATMEVSDVNRTESPAMKYRFLRMTWVDEPGSHRDQCMSWAVKQKINIGSGGWPPTELPEQISKRGGFRAWMAPHVIRHVLNVDEHFDEHPEWYALRGNARAKIERAQLCTTNPEVIEAVAAGLGEMFDARPEVDFMGLGQADGTAFCQCEECRALDTGEIWPDHSGTGEQGKPVITERWLTFVNEVARRLQETHPGKKIYTLAYHQTFRPPDPELVEPEPNVMVQVVNSRPNYLCFVHRFENPDCPNHIKFRRGLERWLDLTPGGVMVYEYNPHSTFCGMPYPAPFKFVDDINYLHRIGVLGYEGQSGPNGWGTYGINHYVIAKATWNGNVDGQVLVQDYCDHAFGPASENMQRLIDTVDKGLQAAGHITEGVWTYMTPEVMAKVREHLNAAQAAAADAGPEVKDRLESWDGHFRRGELGSKAWRTAQQGFAQEDAALLQKAIDLAHEAASGGKLIRVYVPRWQRALEQITPGDATLGETVRKLPETWRFALDRGRVGVEKEWFSPDFDDSEWAEIDVTRHWEKQGYEGYDGTAWYRLTVTITEQEAAEPLLLTFSGVDAEAWVYFNGEQIGHHTGWDQPFAVKLPADTIRPGEENLIAVRVVDNSNDGGMYGKVSLARPK